MNIKPKRTKPTKPASPTSALATTFRPHGATSAPFLYYLPVGTLIQRRKRVIRGKVSGADMIGASERWESFVTTKGAYYAKSDLHNLTDDSVFIRIVDANFDLLIVLKETLQRVPGWMK